VSVHKSPAQPPGLRISRASGLTRWTRRAAARTSTNVSACPHHTSADMRGAADMRHASDPTARASHLRMRAHRRTDRPAHVWMRHLWCGHRARRQTGREMATDTVRLHSTKALRLAGALMPDRDGAARRVAVMMMGKSRQRVPIRPTADDCLSRCATESRPTSEVA